MTLQEKIQANLLELFNSYTTLDQKSIEAKPSETTWSILEIAEHIFLINKAVYKVITTPAPAEKVENTRSELFGEQKINTLLVVGRNSKVPAPDFSNPTGLFANSEDANKNILSLMDKILDHINSNTISAETHTIKHPMLGEMTKVDWVHFMIAHTNRHILQIEEVKGF